MEQRALSQFIHYSWRQFSLAGVEVKDLCLIFHSLQYEKKCITSKINLKRVKSWRLPGATVKSYCFIFLRGQY